jgi:hypothetical protein
MEAGKPPPRLLGGIGLVMRDRYRWDAPLIVFLNWINSTESSSWPIAARCRREGCRERRHARRDMATAFYGNYSSSSRWGLLIQLFRPNALQAVGVRGALMVQPVVVAIGYGTIGPMPLLAVSFLCSR